MVHTDKGRVCFHKDEQGLPYINLDASVYYAATMLVQTVHGNYVGFKKEDINAAKAARQLQGMIGIPSKKGYGGMVSTNMIKTDQLIQPTYPMLVRYLDQTLLVSRGRRFEGNLNRLWTNMWQSQSNWFRGLNLSPWRLMCYSSMA